MNNTGVPASDPLVIISGTVDGTPVTVQTWNSVLQSHLANAIIFQNWISPLMLAALPAPGSAVSPPTSSWSQ